MPTVRELLDSFNISHLEYCVDIVDKGGPTAEYQGIKIFEEQKELTQGTVVNAAVSLYIHYTKTGNKKAENALKLIYDFFDNIRNEKCETWGKIAILHCFVNLKKAGLIDNINEDYISLAKEKTDYSDFFLKDQMKLKPQYATNYLEVAMSCAGFREFLGWEDEGYCSKICEMFVDMLKSKSQLGWMDEEVGIGRYDRYSFIVSADMSDNFHLMGRETPEFILQCLKRSANEVLFMANRLGDGINYGRSLSFYGDTANAKILATALANGLLKEEDYDKAVGYCINIIKKVLDFWFDKERRSLNIWWDGRNTDRYRNDGRILEANINMVSQLTSILDNLKRAGLDDYLPKTEITNPESWESRIVKFEDKENRKFQTAILRKNDYTVMLPFIGAGMWYYRTSYMPFPMINRVVEAAPEGQYPFLIPQITDKNDKILRPVDYFKNIKTETAQDFVKITVNGNLGEWGVAGTNETNIPFSAVYIFEGNTISVTFDIDYDKEFKSFQMLIGTHKGYENIFEVFGFDKEEEVDTSIGWKPTENSDGFGRYAKEDLTKTYDTYAFATPHGFIEKAKMYSAESVKKVGYKILLP